ncbi:hypothetical protein EDD17DRAFT_1627584 [Pisolithus thermaeus]|nr:hypothetical protein EDD17DRAFT_1627584 [Pisolithus thermaeus]
MSALQTLGAGLLERIKVTFNNVCFENEKRVLFSCQMTFLFYGLSHHSIEFTGRASNIRCDRPLNIASMVQEIEVLQVKLDATEDEDEQRALEEDVTGKTLWLCWCGICAEVEELLPKVADYLRRQENMEGLRRMNRIMNSTIRASGLAPQGSHLDIPLMYPGDDQGHLQRIMLDAGENTSKHQLLLAAWAAERVKWSGANKGTNSTTPNTSFQAPSVPVVWQTWTYRPIPRPRITVHEGLIGKKQG